MSWFLGLRTVSVNGPSLVGAIISKLILGLFSLVAHYNSDFDARPISQGKTFGP